MKESNLSGPPNIVNWNAYKAFVGYIPHGVHFERMNKLVYGAPSMDLNLRPAV